MLATKGLWQEDHAPVSKPLHEIHVERDSCESDDQDEGHACGTTANGYLSSDDDHLPTTTPRRVTLEPSCCSSTDSHTFMMAPSIYSRQTENSYNGSVPGDVSRGRSPSRGQSQHTQVSKPRSHGSQHTQVTMLSCNSSVPHEQGMVAMQEPSVHSIRFSLRSGSPGSKARSRHSTPDAGTPRSSKAGSTVNRVSERGSLASSSVAGRSRNGLSPGRSVRSSIRTELSRRTDLSTSSFWKAFSTGKAAHRTCSRIESGLVATRALQVDDPTLLRASELADLLSCFGKIFKSSAGSASTYDMSEPVESIDYFISHNWAVPRWKKFLALSWHFNWVVAYTYSMLAVALCFVLTITGIAPVVEGKSGELYGISGHALASPLFLAILFFRRDVHRCLGRGGPLCFLDKTCIHQTNDELKRQGIAKLGAFLQRSSRIFVIYSDLYLRKLWTVYELACFLMTHPWHHMELVHVSVPILFVIMIVATYFIQFLRLASADSNVLIYGIIFSIYAFLICLPVRQSMREVRLAMHSVRNFRLQDAHCFIEDDRAIVNNNIVAFMVDTQRVDEGVSADDALLAFNCLVQQDIRYAMKCSLGKSGIAPEHVAVYMSLSNFAFQTCIISGCVVKDNPSMRWVVLRILLYVGINFGLMPMAFCLLVRVLGRCMSLTGMVEFLYTCACSLTMYCVIVIGLSLEVGEKFLFEKAMKSDLYLAIFVLYMMLALSAAGALFVIRIYESRARHNPKRFLLSDFGMSMFFNTTSSVTSRGSTLGEMSTVIPQMMGRV